MNHVQLEHTSQPLVMVTLVIVLLVLLVSRVQQVLLFKHHAQHQQIHITLAMALVLLQTLAPGCAALVTTSMGVPALLVLPTPGALQGL